MRMPIVDASGDDDADSLPLSSSYNDGDQCRM